MTHIFKNLILILLLPFCFTTVTAQTPVTRAETLVGVWEMDAHSMISNMEEPERFDFESMSEFPRIRFLENLASRKFTFDASGDFTARWEAHGKHLSTQGRWIWNKEGELQITSPTGASIYLVSFPSDGRMVLEPLGRTQGMLKVLYFNFIESGDR